MTRSHGVHLAVAVFGSALLGMGQANAQASPSSAIASPASAEQAQAMRRMDERLLRQERAAKRALYGICEGRGPGPPEPGDDEPDGRRWSERTAFLTPLLNPDRRF
jgi:hypothetical protein